MHHSELPVNRLDVWPERILSIFYCLVNTLFLADISFFSKKWQMSTANH